ncbi:MAG: SRPBCC domain-containing protein [Acidimicrobiales bacterium]|nr:SRPBCC domain-containing protein [Acidimicrobiales bacterium]
MATPDADARLRTLARPPVRQATLVRSDVNHTFSTFVRTIGQWWPTVPYSSSKERVRDVVVEPRVAGRVYEVTDEGAQVVWGHLLEWDPPSRLALSWQLTPAPTEVEFRFQALGPALTRVSVEHRGWEVLTEAQLAEACALPGGYAGGAFAAGWARILESLAVAAESSPPPGPTPGSGPSRGPLSDS